MENQVHYVRDVTQGVPIFLDKTGQPFLSGRLAPHICRVVEGCPVLSGDSLGEDASRIRTTPLVQIWALARNFALNLYRENGFQNMAQAQRRSAFGLNLLKDLFRMK